MSTTHSCKRHYLIAIIILLIGIRPAQAQQQNMQFKGKVLSASKNPLANTSIIGLDLQSQQILFQTNTNVDGLYSISLQAGSTQNICIEISHLGYEKVYLSQPKPDSLYTITLRETNMELNEIVVKGHRPALLQRPGRYIFTPYAAEREHMDSYKMLHFVPLLQVNGTTINIMGKHASTIYINGRKPIMDNNAVMELLRSTPAKHIERIEIITAPGSAYKASTTGGIVNIVLRKPIEIGFIGTVSIQESYRDNRFNTLPSTYLAYSQGRFSANATMSWSDSRARSVTDTYYGYHDTQIARNTTEEQRVHHQALSGNINMAYNTSEHGQAGVAFYLGDKKYNQSVHTQNNQQTAGSSPLLSTSTTTTQTDFGHPTFSMAAYYTLNTSPKGSKLDINANYARAEVPTLSNLLFRKETQPHVLMPYLQFQQSTELESHGYEFATRYECRFNDDNIVKFGGEYDFSRIHNNFVRKDFDGATYQTNEKSSNDFQYDEAIGAVFINYERNWSSNFSTVIGIRAEHSHGKGKLFTGNETFSRSYLHLFPEVSVLWEMSEGKHALAFDFVRSIARPFYNDLNPFKTWLTENTFTQGNTELKPMLFTELDLRYTLFNDYIIGVSYSRGTDAFAEYSYATSDNNTKHTTANFGSEQTFSMFVNINKQLLNRRWRLMFDASAEYEQAKGVVDQVDAGWNDWSVSAGLRNVILWSRKHNIMSTLSYNYYTPSRGVFKMGKHKHLLSLTTSKTFPCGLSAAIEMYNLFNYKPAYHYNSPTYSFNTQPKTSNFTIQFRLAYTFGNQKAKATKVLPTVKHLERYKK